MILSVLKTETRVLHDRIEQNPRLARLLAADLTPGEYRDTLARLYGFHAPLEAVLGARPEWARIGFSFDARRKAPLLARDLAALGLPPAAVEGLPRCPDLPRLDHFADALGCLYVLEGSTLGGQVIAKHLRRSLGVDAAHGAAFYHSYGRDTGRMWKAFGDMLTACAAPGDHTAIVGAADATFEKMDAWLAPDVL
jgi:heme oxygenase